MHRETTTNKIHRETQDKVKTILTEIFRLDRLYRMTGLSPREFSDRAMLHFEAQDLIGDMTLTLQGFLEIYNAMRDDNQQQIKATQESYEQIKGIV